MTLTLGHYLTLGAMLFALSVVGIFLNRKNLIVQMMAFFGRHDDDSATLQ